MPQRPRYPIALFTSLAIHAVAAAAAPHAQLSDARFDFGKVEQGAHITHEFTVTNTGDDVLRFTGADLSLPGMRARFAPAAIAPGAQGTVTIDWATDNVAGNVEGTAQVRSNDPARPVQQLTLAGAVNAAISIEPIPAVFLSAYTNESAERVLTVRNNADRPFELRNADAGAHADASIAAIEPGKVYTVTVRSKPADAPGRFEGTLTLRTGTGTMTLPLHVWIKPELYANPDAVDFGTVPVNSAAPADAAEQSIVLRNHGGAFAIESIDSDVPAISVTRTPATGRSDSFTLDVRLRAQALATAKSLSGKIRIRTSDPKFPEVVIPVTGATTASTR